VTGGLARAGAAGAAGLALLVVLVGAAGGGAIGGGPTGGGYPLAPSAAAVAAIPADYLALYQQAALSCPGLSWTVLAAIGTVESANGTSTEPGVQFLPATFADYALPVPPGGASPPSPYDPTDAIYAAARHLCANGARNGADLPAAVYAYNHDRAYVSQVLALATRYGTGSAPPAGSGAAAAVQFALGQLGTPYRWGGDGPAGFDCSGLTQAAWAAAGVVIPRTSEAQWAGLAHVSFDALQPGDLVFFNPGEFGPGPGHVGVFLGAGQMVDAPHTGAVVRIEAVAAFGSIVGAARPGS